MSDLPPPKAPARGSTLGFVVMALFGFSVLACGGLMVSSWVGDQVDVALGNPTKTATATRTPRPAATMTATPEPTGTATGTATETGTPAPTGTPTQTPEPTLTPTETETPEPAATQTDTPAPTRTPRPTATPEPAPGSEPVIPGTVLIDVKLNLEQRGMECGELGSGTYYTYSCRRDFEVGVMTVDAYSRSFQSTDFINASIVQYLESPRQDLAEPFLEFVASFVWDCSDEAQAWVRAELPGVFAGGGEVAAEFCGVDYLMFGPAAAMNLQIGGLPNP